MHGQMVTERTRNSSSYRICLVSLCLQGTLYIAVLVTHRRKERVTRIFDETGDMGYNCAIYSVGWLSLALGDALSAY
jgi:hypothetical protein